MVERDYDRFAQLIGNLSRNQLAETFERYGKYLEDKYFCIQTDDVAETYLLAIIEACSKFDIEECSYLDAFKYELLALYETGCTSEHYWPAADRPSLKNWEKAKSFAEKYNLELACDEEEF